MSTYVLVPGGFLGGWAWQRVARRLRAQGHEVYAITLTGLGDRAHLGAPGLECHVVDVLAVLEAEDLRDVVLVGHSYGGVVITAVAARAPERVAHLAYIDANVPHDGESNAAAMRDVGFAAMVDALDADAAQRGDGRFGWTVRPVEEWGLATDDVEWVRSRVVAHPIASVNELVHLGDAAAASFRRTYVLHSDAMRPMAERAQALGATIHELVSTTRGPVGHYPMFTSPQELADVLGSLGSPELERSESSSRAFISSAEAPE